MSADVHFFAGKQDNQALCEYAQSIGLRLVDPMWNRTVGKAYLEPGDDPAGCPFCYLTHLPDEELHPYPTPLGMGIGDATDPLIMFLRSYYKPPHLVMGFLHWYEDSSLKLAKITKPYFSKLAKWIKAHWRKNPEGQYVGPEAQQLIDSGAQIAYLPPGVEIKQIVVGE